MSITFDGFLAGPNNELDWFIPGQDDEINKDVLKILHSVDSWIMGYPTAPGMIAYWKDVGDKGTDPKWMLDIAKALDKLHVLVISNKREKLNIDNTELFVAKNDDELINVVKDIKQSQGGNIYLAGGVRTGQNFTRLGLIDEYRLMVQPIAISKGKPLFTTKTRLNLIDSKAYKSGVVQMHYRPKKP